MRAVENSVPPFTSLSLAPALLTSKSALAEVLLLLFPYESKQSGHSCYS